MVYQRKRTEDLQQKVFHESRMMLVLEGYEFYKIGFSLLGYLLILLSFNLLL
jgi:hypothetical protein